MPTDFQKTLEFILGTPLQSLLSALFIGAIIYYFWKIAPQRFKAFEKLTQDQNQNTQLIAKIAQQYEKLVENSTKVIENNTAALESNQVILKLTTEKIQNVNNDLLKLSQDVKDLKKEAEDIKVFMVEINTKIEK